jgi:hypothetical protein
MRDAVVMAFFRLALRYQGREPYFNAGRASKVPSIPLGLLTKNMDFDPD